MKKIWSYLKEYVWYVDRKVFFLTAVFSAIGIAINYGYGLNAFIMKLPYGMPQFFSWYLVFLIAFGLPYALCLPVRNKNYFRNKTFLFLFFLAPVLFAWKMYYNPFFRFSSDAVLNQYWNRVAYFPFKLIVITAGLLPIWLVFDRKQNFYGCSARNFDSRPYWIMLLIMVPLIAAASMQLDFLSMYPKLKSIRFFTDRYPDPIYKFLYELSYGIDFVGIELFFRGFLVLAFVKWAGRDAILPMAAFYCTIHYGKPIGECISSFFGGIVLGVVTYHTRTIYGGLMVHLGIAWLMELGGYLGNVYRL